MINPFEHFAEEWIASWNSHDVERILAHYADDVLYRSPFVAQLQVNPEGLLRGKAALRGYLQAGLQKYPHLHFRLRNVHSGAGSLVLEYRSVNGLIAAETLVLDRDGRAIQVLCHYRAGEAAAE